MLFWAPKLGYLVSSLLFNPSFFSLWQNMMGSMFDVLLIFIHWQNNQQLYDDAVSLRRASVEAWIFFCNQLVSSRTTRTSWRGVVSSDHSVLNILITSIHMLSYTVTIISKIWSPSVWIWIYWYLPKYDEWQHRSVPVRM